MQKHTHLYYQLNQLKLLIQLLTIVKIRILPTFISHPVAFHTHTKWIVMGGFQYLGCYIDASIVIKVGVS